VRRRRACALLIGLLAPLAPAGSIAAQEPALDEAIEAYTRALDTQARDLRLEEFRRAERLFGRVLESGVASPDLYTNLGNAALQAERLGAAVLAYRRALRLDPDHTRALQNLQHARGLLPEWVPRPETGGALDTFFFWHRTLSRGERQVGAAVCFALAALLGAAGLRWRLAALRNLAAVPAAGWLALLASLLFDPGARLRDEAVIVADETVGRVADSSLAASPFPAPLPGGAEVRLLEERPPWARVRLANGRDTWVGVSALERIADGS
jgi:tetratricopeptide (TPR) repeat protein